MTTDSRNNDPAGTAWAGVRTILVPPDIVAVKRVSPLRVKTRTPWRQRAEGEPIERAGGREWFDDHVFVEAHQDHLKAACGTSITAHASGVILIVVGLLATPDSLPIVRSGPQLVMPAIVSSLPALAVSPPAARSKQVAATTSVKTPDAPPPPPPPASGVVPPAPAPIETPLGIAPETGAEGGATVAAGEGGVQGGVEGGVPGGVVGGVLGSAPSSGAPSLGPLRAGSGIEPPRKIKDVKPVYPQGALSDQARGTVLIEAIVGIDGKVHEAKVIHSVPLLDQAALDAVRQWEFAPSKLNGVPVAVIITVIVQFAIYD